MTSMHEIIENGSDLLERPAVKRQLERARESFGELDAQVRRLVQERPMIAVGAALFFGYALGRLLVRR